MASGSRADDVQEKGLCPSGAPFVEREVTRLGLGLAQHTPLPTADSRQAQSHSNQHPRTCARWQSSPPRRPSQSRRASRPTSRARSRPPSSASTPRPRSVPPAPPSRTGPLTRARPDQNLRRLEAQRNALNARVRLLREELQLLQEPGSYVGEVIKVMGQKKVLVKVQPEGRYGQSARAHVSAHELTTRPLQSSTSTPRSNSRSSRPTSVSLSVPTRVRPPASRRPRRRADPTPTRVPQTRCTRSCRQSRTRSSR